MSLSTKIIPLDSVLHEWVRIHSNTEVPISYLLATGLSAIGALLRRECWVDQGQWNVYPNQSVMLVGPSGVGKDTAINFATKILKKHKLVPIMTGRTIEGLYQRLSVLASPAAAFIPAKELTAYLGGKDYQKTMVNDLTDLLSTNDEIDISTKGDIIMSGGPKVILAPTLTMQCGSTVEWLHMSMPNGSLEGGFFGRFLIVIEELGSKYIPLPKYEYVDAYSLQAMKDAQKTFDSRLEEIVKRTKKLGECVLLNEAQTLYGSWYCNRFKLFSKSVFPYANRSRDSVLRLAMLMAFTRGKFGWIDVQDVQFGIDVLAQVAKGIDHVILPPTKEAQAAEEIKRHLPTTHAELLKALGRKFELRIIQNAETLLEMQGVVERKGQMYSLKKV